MCTEWLGVLKLEQMVLWLLDVLAVAVSFLLCGLLRNSRLESCAVRHCAA